MKTSLLLAFIFLLNFTSQAENLKTKSKEELKKYLLEMAKTSVLKHGPDYYREFKEPVIEKRYVGDKKVNDLTDDMQKEYPNKVFYTVQYPYNENEESFEMDYSAKVFIWEDSGKIFKITFGNGWGYPDLDKPEKKDFKEKMKYEKKHPRKKHNNRH